MPVCLGGLGFGNPYLEASREYASSVKVTTPLVEQIVSQSHELPEDCLVKSAQQAVTTERSKELEDRTERIKEMAPCKTKRALNLAAEKGSSAGLTVLPFQDLGFNLNKRQFRDAMTGQWMISLPHVPAGKFLRLTTLLFANELRDLEAQPLNTVCSDVETEPVLLDISGEQLSRGSNKAQDARLDIHARGFWEHQRSVFFDVRVCHPNAESYKDLEPQQIYRMHENEKKAPVLKESSQH